MLSGPEREDALLGAGFFLVAPGAAEGRIKLVLVECLLEPLCFHHIGMDGRAVAERAHAVAYAFLIHMYQKVEPQFLRLAVAKRDHFPEFPGRVDMHQRERGAGWIEGFHRQMQHHRRILAHGIEHDRVFALGGHFADDVQAFGFESVKVGESFQNAYSPSGIIGIGKFLLSQI